MTDEATEKESTRRELDSWAANQEAAVGIAALAARQLNILTYDLEPQVLGTDEFIEAVRKVATSGRYARVRILVQDSKRAVAEGHKLIEIARRLSSFISIHKPHREHQSVIEAFVVADERALLYRKEADRYEGFADTNDALEARRKLNEFEQMWEKSEPDPEMRRLGI